MLVQVRIWAALLRGVVLKVTSLPQSFEYKKLIIVEMRGRNQEGCWVAAAEGRPRHLNKEEMEKEVWMGWWRGVALLESTDRLKVKGYWRGSPHWNTWRLVPLMCCCSAAWFKFSWRMSVLPVRSFWMFNAVLTSWPQGETLRGTVLWKVSVLRQEVHSLTVNGWVILWEAALW